MPDASQCQRSGPILRMLISHCGNRVWVLLLHYPVQRLLTSGSEQARLVATAAPRRCRRSVGPSALAGAALTVLAVMNTGAGDPNSAGTAPAGGNPLPRPPAAHREADATLAGVHPHARSNLFRPPEP